MDAKNFSSLRFLKSGYTLIELMVVMAIIGVIGTISLFGLNNYRNSQNVQNAQKEFISTLRSAQNQVINGGNGANVIVVNTSLKSPSYTVGSATVILPDGVYISDTSFSLGLALCFANPNLSTFDDTDVTKSCGSCATGNNYAVCQTFRSRFGRGSSPIPSPTTLQLDFYKSGAQTRSVCISTNGMLITRIYEASASGC